MARNNEVCPGKVFRASLGVELTGSDRIDTVDAVSRRERAFDYESEFSSFLLLSLKRLKRAINASAAWPLRPCAWRGSVVEQLQFGVDCDGGRSRSGFCSGFVFESGLIGKSSPEASSSGVVASDPSSDDSSFEVASVAFWSGLASTSVLTSG